MWPEEDTQCWKVLIRKRIITKNTALETAIKLLKKIVTGQMHKALRKTLLTAVFIIAKTLTQGWVHKLYHKEFYNDVDLYLLIWNIYNIF